MKNLKIISAILLASTFLWTTNITSAYTVNNNQTIQKLKDYREKQYLLKEYKKMENMSIDELQNIITKAKINSENRSFAWDVLKSNAKMAWLAFAKIYEKKYPLASNIVVHSVFWEDYIEVDDWKFTRKIKGTSLYKKLLKNKQWNDIFTPSIDLDLYYAIRRFEYFKNYDHMVIKDKFDFKLEWNYENFLWMVANNIWYLSQNIDALEPINIEIIMLTK